MKRWLPVVVLAVVMCFLGTMNAPVLAQGNDPYVSHDEDDWDSGKEKGRKYSVGLGFGLVNLNEEALEDDVERYYMANFRFPVGPNKNEGRKKNAGMRGVLEAEIGYWKSDGRVTSDRENDTDVRLDTSDLLIGLNFIGTSAFKTVDVFVGGGIGYHFVDSELIIDGQTATDSGGSIGVNAQFGADVYVAKKVSLFAVGRFDLVEERNNLEAKAYIGVRFHF